MNGPEAATTLCLNSGSSSVKAALMRPAGASSAPGTQLRVAEAAAEEIGGPEARTWVKAAADAQRRDQRGAIPDHAAAIEAVLDGLASLPQMPPALVAHRVVHGGPRHTAPARVDDALRASLRALTPLAPLHLPAAIAGIEAVARRWPMVPQVACFDTAFHATMPERARRLPLPDRLLGDEVRRYGFHGLSYAHVMWLLGAEPPPRIVIAHLGSGSSLVAVENGRAIDTTMGLTPDGGVLMGTRTGDVDPGLLFYLARARGLSIDDLERSCEQDAGLRAIGGTADMRALLARSASDPRAALAVTMFGYAVRKAIGALAAALGGLDLLVFTGGIGARAAAVRAEACLGLQPLGVRIDPQRNEAGAAQIAAVGSRCDVRVVAADEEATMAREAQRLIATEPDRAR